MKNSTESRILCVADILNLSLDSLEYYSLFPGGDFILSQNWPSEDLVELANKINKSWSNHSQIMNLLDRFTLALFVHGAVRLPLDFDWEIFAKRLSILYINGFKNNFDRKLRMQAQRTNYYIRFLLALGAKKCIEFVGEYSINVNAPWDMLYLSDGEIFIGSGNGENIFVTSKSFGKRSIKLNLPTQLNRLGDNRIAIGSAYSNGWYEIFDKKAPAYFKHSRPVILIFAFNDEEYFLDVDGCVFSKFEQNKILQLPVSNAWRARFLSGKILISDLGNAQSIILLDPNDWKFSFIDTNPVLLMNDVCLVEDIYYVIDKMQGKIFKFDKDFNFLESRLNFGFKPGLISDPISICIKDDQIHIMSWLNNNISILERF